MWGYDSLLAKETDLLLSCLIQFEKGLDLLCFLAMLITCQTYWWELGSSAVGTSSWGAATMVVMRCYWRIWSTGSWCLPWSTQLLCRSGWGQRWPKDIGEVLSTGNIFGMTRSEWIRIGRWIKPWWGMLVGSEVIRRCRCRGEIEGNTLIHSLGCCTLSGLIVWLGCGR